MAGQIALPLAIGQGTARIVVGNANAAAIAAFAHAADWPFRTAILFGPPRSGKTLLARWFEQGGFGEAIDDADRLDEAALFHRWNAAQGAGHALLLTARAAEGAGWRVALPDLASRLAAALRLDIGAPDDAMLAALIAASAQARGLGLSDDAPAHLASRCERSHVGAEMLVAAIDRLSLERKVPPGPAIWREALDEVQGAEQPRLL